LRIVPKDVGQTEQTQHLPNFPFLRENDKD